MVALCDPSYVILRPKSVWTNVRDPLAKTDTVPFNTTGKFAVIPLIYNIRITIVVIFSKNCLFAI